MHIDNDLWDLADSVAKAMNKYNVFVKHGGGRSIVLQEYAKEKSDCIKLTETKSVIELFRSFSDLTDQQIELFLQMISITAKIDWGKDAKTTFSKEKNSFWIEKDGVGVLI